jgi:hypothetical protein
VSQSSAGHWCPFGQHQAVSPVNHERSQRFAERVAADERSPSIVPKSAATEAVPGLGNEEVGDEKWAELEDYAGAAGLRPWKT